MESWSSAEGMYIGRAVDKLRTNYEPGLRPLRRSRRVSKSALSTHAKQFTPVLDNANPQIGSPFFRRLPAEIRRLVYSFVVPSQVIHLRHGFESVTGWPCYCRQGEVCDNPVFYPSRSEESGHLGILGFPLTCRLSYAEAVPVFYHQICFLFLYTRTLKLFCDSLLKYRIFSHGALQSLRSIQIDYRVWKRRTFTAQDEATLCASLELFEQQAPSLEKLYIHTAPRPKPSARLQPVSVNLFRTLGNLRGLKLFDFSVQHPLDAIPFKQLSLQSARQRKEFEEKVADLKKVLEDRVHEPRGVQKVGVDRALLREFARIVAFRRSDA
jgi:hypothetical protein